MEHKIDRTIELNPISVEYSRDIFESFDLNVIKYLPIDEPPRKIEDTQAFVHHSIEQMKLGNDLVWVILFKGKFVGCCGIHGIQSKLPHFGLWIKTDAQGQGIGKKVVAYILDWGISNLNVEYIKYPVDKRNRNSLKLIEGLGLIAGDKYQMGNDKKLDVIEYRLHRT